MASAAGKVIFSGWKKGYGRLVVIDHGEGKHTIYAHTSSNKVKKGQFVQKGQKIAAVGSTGRSTGNHLHFEVRLAGVAYNPLNYLPRDREIASR